MKDSFRIYFLLVLKQCTNVVDGRRNAYTAPRYAWRRAAKAYSKHLSVCSVFDQIEMVLSLYE